MAANLDIARGVRLAAIGHRYDRFRITNTGTATYRPHVDNVPIRMRICTTEQDRPIAYPRRVPTRAPGATRARGSLT